MRRGYTSAFGGLLSPDGYQQRCRRCRGAGRLYPPGIAHNPKADHFCVPVCPDCKGAGVEPLRRAAGPDSKKEGISEKIATLKAILDGYDRLTVAIMAEETEGQNGE